MNYPENLANKNFQAENQHFWPPFTQISLASPLKEVVKAKGALLYTKDSTPIIDGISSWWVTLHGHSNEYIANAIYNQALTLEQVIFADFSHPQAQKLVKRLSDKTGLQRSFFSDNGSTAVEVALKIACQWWFNKGEPRYQIIAFDGAYHGDTFGAMAVGERNLFNAPFEKMLFPVQRLSWPDTWWGNEDIEEREEKTLNDLKRLLETPTAAVIFEPLIQGAGGMRMVREEFLKKLTLIVHQANSLIIADEVMTGFGRSGSMFAHQRAKVQPDLIALSKGLTGGFLPMGITMATEALFEGFLGSDPSKTFWHGHSFTANPLGCAAANASLDLLEQNPILFESFEVKHKFYLEKLFKHPKVIKPRVYGSIAAFEIAVRDNKGYLSSCGKKLKAYCLQKNVFIRPLGNVVYLLPPLCITDSQLEQCYTAIENGLDTL